MLPPRHILLALLTVSIWGFNFIMIKVALAGLPPLLLCAVRFILVAFPAVFFLPRPAIPLRLLMSYGLCMFALQFGFMFLAMHLGLSAGLASLVLQLQVFITMALSATALREMPSPVQITGATVAIGGLGIVAVNTGGDVPLSGLFCALAAALSWAYANFNSRKIGKVNPLALVAWGSLFVPLPMLAASLVFEGPGLIVEKLSNANLATVGSVAFIVYASTHVGYSLWSWLLARHSAVAVTPFTLVVPVVGMISSALFLGEELTAWKIQAAALVLAGLAINVFGQRYLGMRPATARA